jgi:hypothetical protein
VINFRFHLVSLVAVFLALAVGVVMGYGVLGQPTVETLQNRIDAVEANANARRQENEELQAEVDRLDTAIDALEPFAVTDRLLDTPVVIVAVRGVDAEATQGLVSLVQRAGANASGILWIEDNWVLSDAADREALATALGASATRRTALRERAWRALVERLGQGPDVASDLLRTLTDTGFVSFESVSGDVPLATLGGPGTEVLLVVGTDGVVSSRLSLLPAARAAVAAGLPLVGAEMYRDSENEAGRGSLVSLVRTEPTLAAAVSTIDDLDRPSGPTIAVLALADALRGEIGHYGLGEGATAVAPQWWQP